MTDQQPPEETETLATNSTAVEDDKDEHIITETGIAQYETTLIYDEKKGNLVIQETELLDGVDGGETHWSCSCGEEFHDFPGAISHTELHSESEGENQ